MKGEGAKTDRLIERRKSDHIEICAREELVAGYSYWDDVRLIHNALPEVDLADIDTSTVLFGRKLDAPIIISAMTGGYGKAEEINRTLAEVAEHFGIGLGVGSQRAALENPELVRTYSVIREFEVPLRIGNLGAPQLVGQGSKVPLDVDAGRAAMDMVDAHILAIHLNYLQEVVQPEGDTQARGCLEAISEFSSSLPVLAKETGAGISRSTALKLKKAGVKGIDVGGMGGTSFSAVEYFRAKSAGDVTRINLGETFWDWGIPTPVSIQLSTVGVPLIATGGVRSGLDVARAMAIGSSAAGLAGRLLPAALEGKDSLMLEMGTMIQELKTAMFLVGAENIEQLSATHALLTGRSREWLNEVTE
ncbi:MAG: type 2 isopentenyl-diphosphate Delta-isomerase [Thermoplasmata archaeon]|nr:type 2 isopentenyl-diphosphate Delta-isomerase [Thermoplasmata archaeon]TFG68547.1 MAG: type 2 isopentenyl-diphosphate Delta-isomerase [Methanomassiliicoccus sp.]